jgi:hypothetical protein
VASPKHESSNGYEIMSHIPYYGEDEDKTPPAPKPVDRS